MGYAVWGMHVVNVGCGCRRLNMNSGVGLLRFVAGCEGVGLIGYGFPTQYLEAMNALRHRVLLLEREKRGEIFPNMLMRFEFIRYGVALCMGMGRLWFHLHRSFI